MAASYKAIRRRDILERWPVHKQLEAINDKLAGDSSKWDAMQSDIAAIKSKTPKPNKEN